VAAGARFATAVNEQTKYQGRGRRLHTILEKVLDEISFEAPALRKKNVKVRLRGTLASSSRTSSRTDFEPLHSCDSWKMKIEKGNGAAQHKTPSRMFVAISYFFFFFFHFFISVVIV